MPIPPRASTLLLLGAMLACRVGPSTEPVLVADPSPLRIVGDAGDTLTLTVTLANLGDGPIEVLDVVAGPGAPAFVSAWVLGPDARPVLQPGGIVELAVVAELPPGEGAPSALGSHAAFSLRVEAQATVAGPGCGGEVVTPLTVAVPVRLFSAGACDVDGDGFVSVACGGDDCDDADPTVHPGAPELCDGLDNDCDGRVDEDLEVLPWYPDADGDGWGTDAGAIESCAPVPGYASQPGDCDDTDPDVHPGAVEICNGVDDDCDGLIDEEDDDLVLTDWYADRDGDGFGDPDAWLGASCAPIAGGVPDATDCDDDDPEVNPAAVEVCNGVDDDCNGLVDDDPVDGEVFYRDADGDGFGVDPVLACALGPGLALVDGDCDDTDRWIHPGAPEICNGIDDDCDGIVDNDTVDVPWHRDGDSDGFGLGDDAVWSCAPVPGRVRDGTDCNDRDPSIFPGADEVCNGVDDDCDGIVDEDPVDGTPYGPDMDGDGHGTADGATRFCAWPGPGWADRVDDCDDTDPLVHPGAVERCNGQDDDCDGVVDNGAEERVGYRDDDGDGYGDPGAPVGYCGELPPGVVLDGTDCDDGDPWVFPGAIEVCNGVDDDCDGIVDEDAVDGDLWYLDADGDGFGDPTTGVVSCGPLPGRVDNGGDCDDADPLTNPLAAEICDGVDNDCDGLVDVGAVDGSPFWRDADADGFGAPGTAVYACAAPDGHVANDWDCDDTRASVNPAADEVCNGIDDDCDGLVDEDGAIDALTWYRDADGDGYGDPAVTTVACEQPGGFVGDDTDCDDADPYTYPGAPEVCGDGKDNDCNGYVDDPRPWYQDNDGDGFGNPAVVVWACAPPLGFVANADDCNDGNALVYPGAPERCDFLDNDCDGIVDEDPVDASTWYVDADGDGFGDDGTATTGCVQPPGTSLVGGDCDDTRSDVHPGAPEVCDAIDNDCDGAIDEGPGTCLCPIVQHDGKAYGFCTIFAVPWQVAQSSCRTFGYDLVSINDASEQAFLQSTAPGFGGGSWWIGYNDMAIEGQWVWSDFSGSTYTNWAPGQPNNWLNQDCAEMRPDGRWDDVSCLFTFDPFICESP